MVFENKANTSSYSLPPYPREDTPLSTPKHIELRLQNKNRRNRTLQSFYCSRNSDHNIDSIFENPSSIDIADKLRLLVSEFKSLPEPIDRVRRLLDFAMLLPLLEESDRVEENQVRGCTTQVCLMAEMDEFGRMRFKVDSDSEISKGLCWCLVWMLDGALGSRSPPITSPQMLLLEYKTPWWTVAKKVDKTSLQQFLSATVDDSHNIDARSAKNKVEVKSSKVKPRK
ncbi:sufE-like protein 2, chloroplastic [Senna tora]|uniref:SufE-like protein 2, chloroplastic n=1 Tax=Senna tora TaxID=362788 RepID=A0A834SPL0_9FABA|nr:sufE-like protein 2, chloroplastic [Senna tora]